MIMYHNYEPLYRRIRRGHDQPTFHVRLTALTSCPPLPLPDGRSKVLAVMGLKCRPIPLLMLKISNKRMISRQKLARSKKNPYLCRQRATEIFWCSLIYQNLRVKDNAAPGQVLNLGN